MDGFYQEVSIESAGFTELIQVTHAKHLKPFINIHSCEFNLILALLLLILIHHLLDTFECFLSRRLRGILKNQTFDSMADFAFNPYVE